MPLSKPYGEGGVCPGKKRPSPHVKARYPQGLSSREASGLSWFYLFVLCGVRDVFYKDGVDWK